MINNATRLGESIPETPGSRAIQKLTFQLPTKEELITLEALCR